MRPRTAKTSSRQENSIYLSRLSHCTFGCARTACCYKYRPLSRRRTHSLNTPISRRFRTAGCSTRSRSSSKPSSDSGLSTESLVVEVASNDGYLLQHVVAAGIPCLGIESSVNVGVTARERGVPTVSAFLDEQLARRVRAEYGPADVGRSEQRLRAHTGSAGLHPIPARAARRRRLAQHRGTPCAEAGAAQPSST